METEAGFYPSRKVRATSDFEPPHVIIVRTSV